MIRIDHISNSRFDSDKVIASEVKINIVSPAFPMYCELHGMFLFLKTDVFSQQLLEKDCELAERVH